MRRWLLGGDPSITAQVLAHADRTDSSGRSSTGDGEDLVSRILDLQQPDGNWGVGVYDSEGWNSTTDALWLLFELRADPDDERVRHAVHLVHDQVRWEARNGGLPFFSGETEACVNGRVATLGAYFGRPDRALIDRLLREQLPDGGWNCDAPASTRSSFHSTICVLEGLLEFERVTAARELAVARHRGEDYLTERGLLRSKSSHRLLDESWATPHVPSYWCYDALRGLDYLRASGSRPDARITEAVATLHDARRSDGTWRSASHAGTPIIELETAGDASRLTTLRALRVIEWASPVA
ncbi:hypothetical protein E6C64_00010 [Naasia lichenicola]|uniref:Squalene cyclase C-terminal domain-containing protein n=1 Tax=Naasia lichenicola TaxID=2565933 RepID=A0A4S4FU78_9MICO|nr:hypothetical protein E6C64_00010 [Naasia lichenicola]